MAYVDLDNDLHVLDVASGSELTVSSNREGIAGFAWSPDGRYIAFSQRHENSFAQLKLWDSRDRSTQALTSERTNSSSPAFSSDGDWLYFLSDRHLRSLVSSPWGSRQPDPYFDHKMEIYQIALERDLRPPFWPEDELTQTPDNDDENESERERERDEENTNPSEPASEHTTEQVEVEVDREGLAERVWRVPAPPGNYFALTAASDALFFLSRESGPDPKVHLMALEIAPEQEPQAVVEDVRGYRLSQNGKKILVRRNQQLHVIDAKAQKASELGESTVNLASWRFPISRKEDYRQIFLDAWRLERDFFYDPSMHGLDWDAVRDKYLALIDRVTSRSELSHLIGEVVAELSALHVSVRGGDHREGEDQIQLASLGAHLVRDEAAGGYRVAKIYRADPDYPAWRSPLGDPYHRVQDGENGTVITAINGVSVLAVRHPGELLRDQATNPVRLALRDRGLEEKSQEGARDHGPADPKRLQPALSRLAALAP